MKLSIAQLALNECRAILKTTRSDTYYDLKMTRAERGVLIRAAELPDDAIHRDRKLSAWNTSDRNKIKKAARNATEWAKGLEVAL